MEYELSMDAGRVDVSVVHGFLRGCYWSPGIRREVVERAIQNSLVVGAYAVDAEGRASQVGFARGVTDFATFGYVCDVFVLEGHRGRGLARRMVQMLMDEPRVQTLRRWALATRDAHGVYEGLGFGPVQEGRWMEKQFGAERWGE